MTFVSIIIPFNKPERYLKDCLDSILEQQLTDYEIILVLNGVREDLSELRDSFGDRLNIKAMEFPQEIEVGKARNIGLDMAEGNYIYFIDSDDYLYEDALNRLIDAAKRTGADFVNGERIRTPFIRQRFNEELEKPNVNPLRGNEDDMNFSIRLLVGDKTDGHEFFSSLHSLIKRDRIANIRFNESERYFTDYDFMLNVLDNIESFCGVENAIYAKRIRDDSVNVPSLNQEIEETDFSLFLKQYPPVRDFIDSRSKKQFEVLKEYLIGKLHKFYYHSFSHEVVSNEDERWSTSYINDMAEIAKDFDSEKLSWKEKSEIKALTQNDISKYLKLVNFRYGYVNLKKMIKEPWRVKKAIYDYHYNRKNVRKNKILFESFYGRYYSDSPKYIYEYLNEYHGDDFEMVWVVDNEGIEIPGNPKKVKRLSLDYYNHLAQSEYYVFNTRHSATITKKPDQKFICTWHGTPLKRLGFDIDNLYINNPNVKHVYKRDSKMWDYMISPNRYTTDILRSAFAYDGEIIESGYPRNDILYNADSSKVDRIKESLSLPKDKKIILYAPTWRDDEQIDATLVNFSLKLDLEKLRERFSDDYIILLRMHYFVANKLNLDNMKGFAFDVSDYEDIAELYLISDILITDYSSVFFDFANLERPMLFFTYDLEKYEQVLRGFYIDIHEDIPGPLLKTNDEVIDAIANIDAIADEYREKYAEFYQRFCSIDDGNASKRIYERIWKS